MKRFLLGILLLAFVACDGDAMDGGEQGGNVPNGVSSTVLTNRFTYESIVINSTELAYRKAIIGEPSAESTALLVLYLHGGSSRGGNNEAQLAEDGVASIYNYLVAKKKCAIMLVPQCPQSSSWGKSMNKVLKALITDNLSNVDTSRIYAFGGSMGGTGLWSLISDYTGLFAAAMPVAANPSGATVERVVPTQVYTVMGAADQMMKIDVVETFVEALREAGGAAMLDVIEGWNHATTCNESYTTNRLDWIFSKQKPRSE
ncbi:MAG: dienelactone hydrolase family protein [Rikenellaceae bacterium]|nr:dienelactone hydrolase family protein [Rikenellaceae bacterium]